jgi:hypothetical protein
MNKVLFLLLSATLFSGCSSTFQENVVNQETQSSNSIEKVKWLEVSEYTKIGSISFRGNDYDNKVDSYIMNNKVYESEEGRTYPVLQTVVCTQYSIDRLGEDKLFVKQASINVQCFDEADNYKGAELLKEFGSKKDKETLTKYYSQN